ncbi:BspA family leucine-rich repeat surface protein [Flavobacterium arcticum]|uniref:BspA family leucine-rich repeat surface protein n=1 Tax=Flavobacterium arcticum TaxID=1784713 RepID=A0A345H8U5_9FLAO|nr:BspA family leucine-rich repeat surface protein [Flavobacterium arcticum]AXG73005.1 BspA family leucine-rich repeat surface protein [Flavobacterium arcticum]KAF2510332.1 BspA family leucine-rich repeat surface protein [Flavobacterium arcticum]
MKKNYLLFIFSFIAYFANAQAPFITTWQVQDDNLTIYVPILEDDAIPDSYTIDFGDGNVLTNQSSTTSHTYTSEGIYTVTISGDFSRIRFYQGNENSYSNEILTIEQWGDIQWTNMENAFYDCTNLTIAATDIPDLSQVTDMGSMFYNCHSLNQPLNDWDVSNVTDMYGVFYNASSFNQPLNNWDVSNVTNMWRMFKEASSFNQPLNNWDVSSVTNMSSMFWEASSFDQPLNNWEVSSVTNMGNMFYKASSFNQPLNNWEVSSVIDMSGMFSRATSFNQSLNNWDVSNVTNMMVMFSGATSFNGSLNDWDVSNVIYISLMFEEATSFNQPLDSWDVSNMTNLSSMFWEAQAFNQPLNDWDVSNVTNMSSMFSGSGIYEMSFNQPLNDWDVSNVTNINRMFEGATSFNRPLDSWDVSNVTNMTRMFYNATSFNQDISNWTYNLNVDLSNMLKDSDLNVDNYDALLNQFAQLALENKNIGANGLEYCDFGVRDYLINELGWEISGDSLSEDCDNNTLSGTVLFDDDNNGCDTDDIAAVHLMVNANNGTYNYATTINSDGTYNLNLLEGTYDVTLLNIPDYFTVSTDTDTVNFTGSDLTEDLSFCLTATEMIEDLKVTLLPITEARPGFEAQYQLIVENMGTQTVANATVAMIFDDAMQTFVTATPTATAVTINQLTFTIENLLPLENRVIDITMQIFTPPTVNGGDIANITATIIPNANDNVPYDNTSALKQEIVNSFDPNDKRVVQGEQITIDQTGHYLDYIIRFQNTGSASAIAVRVEDDLHEKLDWTTFKPISSSHDYRVEITDGSHVEFIFENINLPHENADAEGSNGFIAYKIKPVADIAVGDIISGDAEIYFDYNLPIITNDATTEVILPLTDPQDFFITTWQVTSNDLAIEFPIVEDDDIPDSYTIDFGDGTVLTGQSGTATHTYSGEGIYTVTLSGDFSRVVFGNLLVSNSSKLLTIEQWGDTQWTSMELAFRFCINLSLNATDVPDLSMATTTEGMFLNCQSLNQPLNNWDVSSITDMSYMFNSASSLNQPLNDWNISNVTDMSGMFNGASDFDQPLNDWDVSSVTNMSKMFNGALDFNQSLNDWDVSSVTDMSGMFELTISFNQPLNNWSVANVTDMSEMFNEAGDFNQSLNDWDVSSVTDMSYMFNQAGSFNQPLNNWDVSNVTNMVFMFGRAYNFNQPLSNWNVSNVTNMSEMFYMSEAFNQSLNDWDVSNVTTLEGMFRETAAFNQPLNNWDVSSVINMIAMFFEASSFNQSINNWDVSNVKDMSYMFTRAYMFNQDLSDWTFNNNIKFTYFGSPGHFLDDTDLNIDNYDALLNRFVELGLENKTIGVDGLEYCDIETHNELVDNKGWTFVGDSVAEDCTANTEIFVNNQIVVYPNPVTDFVYIQSYNLTVEEVIIYDLQGSQLIATKQNLETINTANLSAGIYLLYIKTNKGLAKYKLVKN